MGNLWVSLSLEKYNREEYSILYINFNKREVEGGSNRFGRWTWSPGKQEDSAVNRHEFWGLRVENGCTHKV